MATLFVRLVLHCLWRGTGRDKDLMVGLGRGCRMYLTLDCRHQNDLFIKMGSVENGFNSPKNGVIVEEGGKHCVVSFVA